MLEEPMITAKDIQWRYAVTHMTVYNWMKGSARRHPLPHVKTPMPGGTRCRVTFSEADVKKWASEHGIAQVRRGASKPVTQPRTRE